jgi:hypothetical protein
LPLLSSFCQNNQLAQRLSTATETKSARSNTQCISMQKSASAAHLALQHQHPWQHAHPLATTPERAAMALPLASSWSEITPAACKAAAAAAMAQT